MVKELTPEEKKQFGLEGSETLKTGGLTPEQMAKNFENQKNIQGSPSTPSVELTPEIDPSSDVTEEVLENEIDLSKDTLEKTAVPMPEAVEEGVEYLDQESSILDLDTVLDKADHTYEIEKESINTAPGISKNVPDNLEAQLADTEPANPEKEALLEQALHNEEERLKRLPTEDKKHVRTFHKDISSLKHTGDTAITSQMLRESHQEDREKKAELQAGNQIKTFSIIGAVLIVVAIGVIMYVTKANKPSTTALLPTNTIPSLLPADTHVPIDVTNAYHFKIKSVLAEKIAEQTTFKQLAHLYFGKASRNGGALLSTGEFFTALDIAVPSSLLEVTTDQFMFGTYTIQEPYPFLLLPVTSFPKAQNAMSIWEGDMLRDLKDVFAIPSEYTEPEAFNSKFRHDIVNNQHVQLLYTPIIETLEEIFISQPVTPEVTEETRGDELINESLIENESNINEESEGEANETMVEEESEEQEVDENMNNQESENTELNDEVLERPEIVIPEQQTLTQTQRVTNGENITLLYTFINEYTLLITTDPIIIPEIVKRYTNRQIFLR